MCVRASFPRAESRIDRAGVAGEGPIASAAKSKASGVRQVKSYRGSTVSSLCTDRGQCARAYANVGDSSHCAMYHGPRAQVATGAHRQGQGEGRAMKWRWWVSGRQEDDRHGRRDVPQAAGRRPGGRQRPSAAARGREGSGRALASMGAREARVSQAAHAVRVRGVRPDEGRRRAAYAVLQGLSAAVLLPDDGRDGQCRAAAASRW